MMDILMRWFEGYGPHDAMYILALAVCASVFLWGHWKEHINIWEIITTTDKTGQKRTDSRKLQEFGAFLVMTIGFSYMIITGKMSEWYAGIYVTAFVAARTLRDIAQLKDKALSLQPKKE